MKYYIIAGEASGDLHGSNLIKELAKRDDKMDVRCWGGDKMKAAGGHLVKHFNSLAFMGFAEVLMNLRTIFRNLAFCKKDILAFQPDAIILIDYPGFNIRIAKWAKKNEHLLKGCKIIYYISPQVWAWKENRVKSMKKCIDKMLVILPFEKDYYQFKWNWEVEYVGHPLIEEIEKHRQQNSPEKFSDKPIIALLPGSRKQEILKKLPIMLEASRSFPDYQFIVAKAPGTEESFYQSLLQDFTNVSFVNNKTYDLLLQAKAAIVTSGTATLETALFGVPEMVCYKGSYISYQIGKRLVKVKFISLVNLIMNKAVVKELVQNDFTLPAVKKELTALVNDERYRQQLQTDYTALWNILSTGGPASANAADIITDCLR